MTSNLLLFYAAAIVYLQICFCDAITRDNLQNHPYGEDGILVFFHRLIPTLPNVKSDKVDRFQNNLRKIIRDHRADKNNALLELLFAGTNLSQEEQADIFGSHGGYDILPTDDMETIKQRLDAKLPGNTEQNQEIMTLLSQLNMLPSSADQRKLLIDWIMYAIEKSFGKTEIFASEQPPNTLQLQGSPASMLHVTRADIQELRKY